MIISRFSKICYEKNNIDLTDLFKEQDIPYTDSSGFI